MSAVRARTRAPIADARALPAQRKFGRYGVRRCVCRARGSLEARPVVRTRQCAATPAWRRGHQGSLAAGLPGGGGSDRCDSRRHVEGDRGIRSAQVEQVAPCPCAWGLGAVALRGNLARGPPKWHCHVGRQRRVHQACGEPPPAPSQQLGQQDCCSVVRARHAASIAAPIHPTQRGIVSGLDLVRSVVELDTPLRSTVSPVTC